MQLTAANGELSRQLHATSSAAQSLEADNARLAHAHAALTVEVEAVAAELRSARGEAAELAADRSRLLAALRDGQAGAAALGSPPSEALPRITITDGGIPASRGAVTGTGEASPRLRPLPASPSSRGGEDSRALVALPVDTGAHPDTQHTAAPWLLTRARRAP